MADRRTQAFSTLCRVSDARLKMIKGVLAQRIAELSEARAALEDAKGLLAAYDLGRFDSRISAPQVQRNQRFAEQVKVLVRAREQAAADAEGAHAAVINTLRATLMNARAFERLRAEAQAQAKRALERKMRRSAQAARGSAAEPWSMLNEQEDA